MERKGITTMKGNPMTLVGPELKPGDKAPDFTVLDQTMAPKTLRDFDGKFRHSIPPCAISRSTGSTRTQPISPRMWRCSISPWICPSP